MGGMGGAKVPRTPPLGGVAQTEPSAPPPEPDPPETERANFDAENHPLAGVPNVEARHDRGGGFKFHLFFRISKIGEHVPSCTY